MLADMHLEIVAQSKHFGAHPGLLDQSFVMLLSLKLQADNQRLRTAFKKMPARFELMPSHCSFDASQTLLEKHGNMRFVEGLDRILAEMAPPEENTTKGEEMSDLMMPRKKSNSSLAGQQPRCWHD